MVLENWKTIVDVLFSSEVNGLTKFTLIKMAHKSIGAHVEDIDDKVGKLVLLLGSDPGLGDAPHVRWNCHHV